MKTRLKSLILKGLAWSTMMVLGCSENAGTQRMVSDQVPAMMDGSVGNDRDLGHAAQEQPDARLGSDAGMPINDVSAQPSESVGFRTDELTYTPIGHEEPRTLPVSFWYPSNETEGTPASTNCTQARVRSSRPALP